MGLPCVTRRCWEWRLPVQRAVDALRRVVRVRASSDRDVRVQRASFGQHHCRLANFVPMPHFVSSMRIGGVRRRAQHGHNPKSIRHLRRAREGGLRAPRQHRSSAHQSHPNRCALTHEAPIMRRAAALAHTKRPLRLHLRQDLGPEPFQEHRWAIVGYVGQAYFLRVWPTPTARPTLAAQKLGTWHAWV